MMTRPSFEELVAQLEACAKRLEAGNIPLEEALTTYEQGAALVRQLRQLLAAADLRVQQLQGDIEEGSALRQDVERYNESPAPDGSG